MTDRRTTLPRDVNGIFKGAALPEDVARRCTSYHAPTPRQAGPQVVALRGQEGDPSDPPASPALRVRPVKDVRIEALMETVPCPKNHVCYRSGFEGLCRARAVLGGRVVECLERGLSCGHRLSLLHKGVCRCAIRHHVLLKLGR